MIRLFKVKEKQKELTETNGGSPLKRQSAGELLLHKDISELNLPKSCTILFPNGKDDLMNFEISIKPDEGYYTGGKFLFTFEVSAIYPHEPPKVKCKTKDPNHEDPLNHDAAAVLRDNLKLFEYNVRRAMAGGYVGQTSFTRCM